MKGRGKALDAYSFNNYIDFNYSSSSDMPCIKHPSSSSVGICPYCLKDRLVNLVCSECGEQRLSSCSCSDVSSSSYRNSCTGEVGSVGRISFLIENEKTDHDHHAKPNKGDHKSEEVIFLRRSNSSCVEIKRSKNGFWKIKRLFRKRREKGISSGKDHSVFDDKSDFMGVSRSRSLCSFRNGGLNDADEGSDYAFSSAKISDVTGGILFDSNKPYSFNEFEPRKSGFRGLSDAESEPRKSGFRGLLSDAENEPRRSGSRCALDAENEPRKSGFRGLLDGHESGVNNSKSVKKLGGAMELNRVNSVPNWSVFPIKESDFSAMDESAFIDLKLDLSLESKREFSAARISAASDHDDGCLRSEVYVSGVFLKNVKNSGGFSSCRIPLNEKELKSGSKGHKVWKWIFRQSPSRRSASKSDGNNILKS